MHEYAIQIVAFYLAATCAIGGALVLLGGLYAVQFLAYRVYGRIVGWKLLLEAMKLLQEKNNREYLDRVRGRGQTIKSGS